MHLLPIDHLLFSFYVSTTKLIYRPFNLLAFYDLRVPSVSTASVQDTTDSTSSLYLTQMLPINLPFQPFPYQIKKTNTNSIYWNVSYRSQDVQSITVPAIKDKDESKKDTRQDHLSRFSNHIYLHYPPHVYVWQSWLVGQINTCKHYFCFVFLLFYLFIHLFLTYQLTLVLFLPCFPFI